MANSNVLNKLSGGYYGTQCLDDGTVKGIKNSLKKNDFSSTEVWNQYKSELNYFCLGMLKAFNASSEEEEARVRNNALQNLKTAYKIIEEECKLSGVDLPEYGLTIGKKQIRAWQFIGIFARLKRDYGKSSVDIAGKTWAPLQEMVEYDISCILNGKPRLEKAKVSKSVQKVTEKADEKTAKDLMNEIADTMASANK